MKRMVRCLMLLCCTASLAAQRSEAWQSWRYSARIDATVTSADHLVSVTIPAAVTARARREWTDLRVIDAQGAEVPFVLHARLGGKTSTRHPVSLLEPSVVEGQYQQAVVHAGERGVVHNSVQLHVETTRNLLGWVEIAVSGDLKEWRVVRDRAPIYVLRAEGMGENTAVSYPDSASEYVRIRILDGSGTYKLSSAELGYETTTVAERVPAGVEMPASADRQGDSVWTSEGDASALPMSRVEFQTPQATFFRHALVECSDTGDQWRLVASGDILRAPDGARERDWLVIDFRESYARQWRVRVANRNDAPVANLRPVFLTAPRRVVFQQKPGESYRLLYGHPRAQAPRYDMAQLTDVKALEAAEPATLGAEEENPAWVDPSPWTERYDAVLWVALIAAVIVLGVVAVRTLRG